VEQVSQRYVRRKLDDLTPHPANPRQGDVGAIHQSIEANGFYGAVIVQKSTGYVLAGNHRMQAAANAGATSLPVIEVDVDDATATRILLADNRTNDVATYDQDALAGLLRSLAEDGGLAGSGYDGDDVDALLQSLEHAPYDGDAPEPAPEPPKPVPVLKEWTGETTTPYIDADGVRLFFGDCIEVMAEMDEGSVDAVVCDPPYGLEFMGKEWDAPWKGSAAAHATARTIRADEVTPTGQAHSTSAGPYLAAGVNKYEAGQPFAAWCEQWAREAYRVLKPGGHLLAFGGTRTFHRLTCGIEDAGFEVRDCLSWLYGSGFPKSLDVSKAIDKAAGHWRGRAGEVATANGAMAGPNYERTPKGDPVTAAAAAGWGTALKPAWEPCVVARKPLAGTVAENVQAHGTGALNVDGCRIPHGDDVNMEAVQRQQHAEGSVQFGAAGLIGSEIAMYKPGGRWPANVVLDEQAAAMLDAQSGVTTSGAAGAKGTSGFAEGYDGEYSVPYGDTGGASRFFYTAKASRADRSTNGANNTHPTVKPTDLMRWLVRLVTPPGGVVLDPFAGSGSTLVAARAEGIACIGIEREQEYAEIIVARLGGREPDEDE
jgi:site-specific DNA-methyltransferase (adenine-specific)